MKSRPDDEYSGFIVPVTNSMDGSRLPEIVDNEKVILKLIREDSNERQISNEDLRIGAYVLERLIGLVQSQHVEEIAKCLVEKKQFIVRVLRVRPHSVKISFKLQETIKFDSIESYIASSLADKKNNINHSAASAGDDQTERSAQSQDGSAELGKISLVKLFLSAFVIFSVVFYVLAPDKVDFYLQKVTTASKHTSLAEAPVNNNADKTDRELSKKNDIEKYKVELTKVLQKRIYEAHGTSNTALSNITFKFTKSGRISTYSTNRAADKIRILEEVLASTSVPQAPYDLRSLSVDLYFPVNFSSNDSSAQDTATERSLSTRSPIYSDSNADSAVIIEDRIVNLEEEILQPYQTGVSDFPWVTEEANEIDNSLQLRQEKIYTEDIERPSMSNDFQPSSGDFPWVTEEANEIDNSLQLRQEKIYTEDIERPSISDKSQTNWSNSKKSDRKQSDYSPIIFKITDIAEAKLTLFRKFKLTVNTNWLAGDPVPSFSIASKEDYADKNLAFDPDVTPSVSIKFDSNKGVLLIRSKARVVKEKEYVFLVSIEIEGKRILKPIYVTWK